jgi:hypothetical protein
MSQQFVRSKADTLGFANVFNNPVREKILMAECKEKASNARTQFRRQVRVPIFFISLAPILTCFCVQSLLKVWIRSVLLWKRLLITLPASSSSEVQDVL